MSCFIVIRNKSFWSVSYLSQGGTTQHSEPCRGKNSSVGRLHTFTIRSDEGPHPHQITLLAARVRAATGSLPIATSEATGTRPFVAPLLYLLLPSG